VHLKASPAPVDLCGFVAKSTRRGAARAEHGVWHVRCFEVDGSPRRFQVPHGNLSRRSWRVSAHGCPRHFENGDSQVTQAVHGYDEVIAMSCDRRNNRTSRWTLRQRSSDPPGQRGYREPPRERLRPAAQTVCLIPCHDAICTSRHPL